MRFLLLLSAMLLLAPACPPSPVSPDAGIPDAAPTSPLDASACLFPAAVCCKSCLALARLGCPEGRPTAGGTSCESACQLVAAANLGVALPDISACRDVACVRALGVACR